VQLVNPFEVMHSTFHALIYKNALGSDEIIEARREKIIEVKSNKIHSMLKIQVDKCFFCQKKVSTEELTGARSKLQQGTRLHPL